MKTGWQTKRLGDFAAAVSTGPFGSILHKSDYVDDGVPLVNPTNIVGERIVPDPSKLISEETIKRLSNYVLEDGDIVVGRRGEIGRCAVVGPNESGWVCGTGSFFVRPLPTVDSQFLAHLIRSPEYREQLEKLSTGATMKNLRNTALGDLVVSVPPLAEQQRIAGLLDEAFEGLATAKANAEKNLQNARALFESHLQSVFTQRGLGWVEKPLGDLSRINYGYTESASAENVGPHFLRITDIQDNGVDWDTVPYCPIDASDLPKYRLADGDIVFARTGATTGKSYLVSNPPESVFASYLIRVQLSDKDLLPQFVNLFFQTHSYWDTIRAGVSGSAQGGFNATKLGELVIPFPKSSKEQMSVVARLEKLTTETQRLARLYERKLTALEALKTSLLHQAFTGEL